jgi:hypothetical protein
MFFSHLEQTILPIMQLGNSITYAGLFEHEGGMRSLALVSRAANTQHTIDFARK